MFNGDIRRELESGSPSPSNLDDLFERAANAGATLDHTILGHVASGALSRTASTVGDSPRSLTRLADLAQLLLRQPLIEPTVA